MNSSKFSYRDDQDFHFASEDFIKFIVEKEKERMAKPRPGNMFFYFLCLAITVIGFIVVPALEESRIHFILFLLSIQLGLIALMLLLNDSVDSSEMREDVWSLEKLVLKLALDDEQDKRAHLHHIDSKIDEVIHRLEKLESGKDDSLTD